MATTHYNTISYIDKTGEVTTFKVFNDAVTAVSIASYLAQITELRARTDDICIGKQVRATWVGDADDEPADLTTISNLAQRENKLLVTYEDTTTHEHFNLSIGTIDLTKLVFTPGGKDAVSLTSSAEIIAWITAFEAVASPPNNPANNVNVIALRFVGRNS